MIDRQGPRGPSWTKREKDSGTSKYSLSLKELLDLPEDELGLQVWLTGEQLDELMALPEEEIQAYYNARPEEGREKDEWQYELFHDWDELSPEEEAKIEVRLAELRRICPGAPDDPESLDRQRQYVIDEHHRQVNDQIWDSMLKAAKMGKYAPNLRARLQEPEGTRKVMWRSDELGGADLPAMEMLVPAISLPIGAPMILAGPPGSGKSWLALDMAMSLSLGLDFLGQRCPKARVMYIDEESSVISTADRHNALKKGHGYRLDFPNRLTFLMKGGVRLDLDRDVDNLIDLVWHLDIDVILFDSLIRMHRGDENSARDMAIVSQNLNRLMSETGIAVVLIQHARKRFQGAPQRESVRGSSELTAWPDLVLSTERRGSSNLLRCLKSRVGEEWAPIGWVLNKDEDAVSLETTDVTSLDFTDQRRLEVRGLLLELMSDGQERSRKALVEYARDAGYGKRLCTGTLQILEEEGLLTKEKRGSAGAYWYRMTEQGRLSLVVTSVTP